MDELHKFAKEVIYEPDKELREYEYYSLIDENIQYFLDKTINHPSPQQVQWETEQFIKYFKGMFDIRFASNLWVTDNHVPSVERSISKYGVNEFKEMVKGDYFNSFVLSDRLQNKNNKDYKVYKHLYNRLNQRIDDLNKTYEIKISNLKIQTNDLQFQFKNLKIQTNELQIQFNKEFINKKFILDKLNQKIGDLNKTYEDKLEEKIDDLNKRNIQLQLNLILIYILIVMFYFKN